jgi:glycosyltransferase involved in cell wall biosynthesis
VSGRACSRALRSVAAQDTPPVEVIVVDDGDPLRCAAAPAAGHAFGVAPLTVSLNRRAKGASGARNSGAALASGDVLAFLDDDDEWAPSYLREVMQCWDAARVDVVCTAFVLRFDDGTERPGKGAPTELSASRFLTRNPGLIGSNLVIHRALYLALGGFDESLQAAEDMDFGLRLSLHGDVRYAALDRPLVIHHQHRAARLCTPRGAGMRAGIRRFYELHGPRMSEAQQEDFRRSVGRLWGIDEHGRDAG